MNKSIKGIGMSDWGGYANILSEKFSFLNTYYHTEPKLDLTSDDWSLFSDCDFVLCMEVMEHIPAPFKQAVVNINKMLKDTGVLVFSTPFTDRSETKEHFPGLEKFVTVKIDNQWVVLNKTNLGYNVFDKNIYFHGGPGTVLEMRIFSKNAVTSMLREANFEIEYLDSALPDIGYLWPLIEERPGNGLGLNYLITARPNRTGFN